LVALAMIDGSDHSNSIGSRSSLTSIATRSVPPRCGWAVRAAAG
jgi:hypothetical protein